MSADTGIQAVREVIKRLVGPGGCPWDAQQTPETLCDYVIEESHELAEAIRSGDAREAGEELGDVLFLLLFIATLYENAGDFTLEEAAQTNAEKMIRRHPHVFGDLELENREQLLVNWERIKRTEQKKKDKKGVFESLPEGLPPALKAYRICSKAARVGFTWESDADAMTQFWGELAEFERAPDQDAAEAEFGDMLFTLVEVGRRRGLKANAALARANAKFLDRFQRMESLAEKRGLDFPELSLDEKNDLWDEAKKAE